MFTWVNILRPRQNGRNFADDILKCIFLNENAWISLNISLKFVLKVRINNIPALVQMMAWSRPGDKPLSEPMMVSLLTHICVTRPQWVNSASAAYMRQWFGSTLVQIMAWRLFSAKPLSELMRTYWTLRKKFQWNLIPSTILFLLENTFRMSSGKWQPVCPVGRWVDNRRGFNGNCVSWRPHVYR